MNLSKEEVKEWQEAWRRTVRDVFTLYDLEMTDEQIDYHFLSSPNRAKRILTETQFCQWLLVWKEYF